MFLREYTNVCYNMYVVNSCYQCCKSTDDTNVMKRCCEVLFCPMNRKGILLAENYEVNVPLVGRGTFPKF